MRVKDAMTPNVIGIQSDAPIAQAIDLMLQSRVSGLPVYDADKTLVGILSEGDLLRRAELGTEGSRPRWIAFLLGPGRMADAYVHSHGRKVAEVMTGNVVTIAQTASLGEAVELMRHHSVKRLPVIFNGKVVGILTRADLLRCLATQLPATDRKVADADLRSAILAQLEKEKWAPVACVDVEVADGVVSLGGTITDERQREALHVVVENLPGVKAIHDHLVWVEGNSGAFLLSAEDQMAEKPAKAAV